MIYQVRKANRPPELSDSFESPAWSHANIAPVDQFHENSSSHRPRTQAKLLWADRALYLSFLVHDQYVRCTRQKYQELVSKDTCVEFFVQPREGKGYFNFEINCGGTMLLYYIEDATRTPTAPFRSYTPVSAELGSRVHIRTTLPSRVEPEIKTPVTWELSCVIPLDVLEHYVGDLRLASGQSWRGNFFKCADESSHPHWASWSLIGPTLRFHQPDRFAALQFTD
jgi:hypothetical protein